MINWESWKFWVVVLIALTLRALTSGKTTFIQLAISYGSGVLAAWVGTEPLLDFFDLDPEKYELIVAALLALTGENIVNRLISFDPVDTFFSKLGVKK